MHLSRRRPARPSALATVALLCTSALTVTLLASPSQAGIEDGIEAKPRKTRVSGTLSATVANPGGAVVMSGYVKAKGKKTRTVVLEQKLPGGWRKVGKGKSDATGAYALAVPTDWFYSSKLRTRVTKKGRKYRGATSRAHRMQVVPAYVPLGSPQSWKPISRYGHRLDPCRTITYGINFSRATPDAGTAVAGVTNTMAMVAQATGMRFTYVGETTAMPFDKRLRRKDPTIVFGFTTDAETSLDLGPSVAARGGAEKSRWARNARGKRIAETVKAGVIYDLSDTAVMTATQFQQLTMHEVGHVMGLGHVAPIDQVMTGGPEGYDLPVSYQAGDLHGLSEVGLQSGCLRPFRGNRKVALQRVPAPTGIHLD